MVCVLNNGLHGQTIDSVGQPNKSDLIKKYKLVMNIDIKINTRPN